MTRSQLVGSVFLWCIPFMVVGQSSVSVEAPGYQDYGFFYSKDTWIDGAERTRGLGPVYERRVYPNGNEFLALRPFFSRVKSEENNRQLDEYLWPLAMRKTFRDEVHWRVLIIFGHDFGDEDNPATEEDLRTRFWAFPFVMTGKDVEGDRYFGVFPLGGHLKEFLGKDEITFVLFPLYNRYTVNDLVTRDVLWPFVSWTTGGPGRHFRVLPFYGEHSEPGVFKKRTVMWPLFMSSQYTGKGAKGSGWVLFPLAGHTKLDNQESFMLFPPFFRWSVHEDRTLWYLPWPFIQIEKGPVNRVVIWPLYGHKRTEVLSRTWWLWPIYSHEKLTRVNTVVERRFIVPFFYVENRWARDADGHRTDLEAQSTKVWPLLYRHEESGLDELRLLDLWPFKRTAGIEKNLSPFWSVYTVQKKGSQREDSLFFGLYRRKRESATVSRSSLFPLFDREKDGARKRLSFLKGLVEIENEGDDRRYRLLYVLRFGKRETN